MLLVTSIITRSTSLDVAKAGNLKLDFMTKRIGIHFFEFEYMFRCYRDNENLRKHFGHMGTLRLLALRYYNSSFPG